ncbi:hypothetical protein ACRHQP_00740 [Burkholderia pseudomallei]|uniref:hypothetical protein n=1 Tax=Burkholderia pseudomallei TaxID=28450 RepID=UPI004063CADE
MDEREMFEAWRKSLMAHPNLMKDADGYYEDYDTQIAWSSWQARAASANETWADGAAEPYDEGDIERHFDDHGFYLHGFEEEDRANFFKAALALVAGRSPAMAVAIPTGYALVPIEPTTEMLNCWWDGLPKGTAFQNCTPRGVYAAMLAAAPQPAQADARVGLTESAAVARIERLRKALFESRDAMRVMSNWAKKPDPAGHSWAVRMVDRANAALNGGPEPRAEVMLFADNDERDEFIRVCQDFDDGGETCVDYELLMKWASNGLLDCDHFTITKKGRAAIDAARTGASS